LIVSLLPYIK